MTAKRCTATAPKDHDCADSQCGKHAGHEGPHTALVASELMREDRRALREELPPLLPPSAQTMGIACGNCGGPLLMATCDHFRGTGHEWVIVSICMLCRKTHWTKDGCRDCSAQTETGR